MILPCGYGGVGFRMQGYGQERKNKQGGEPKRKILWPVPNL